MCREYKATFGKSAESLLIAKAFWGWWMIGGRRSKEGRFWKEEICIKSNT